MIRAYKQLALKIHPDKNGAASAEEAFKKLRESFTTLNDPAKRLQHDGATSDPSGAGTSRGHGFVYALNAARDVRAPAANEGARGGWVWGGERGLWKFASRWLRGWREGATEPAGKGRQSSLW